MEYEEKVIRVKERIEYLRKIHGLKKLDITNNMGFSRQHYYQKYHNSSAFSLKGLIGITNFFGLSEYDLFHSTDQEFNKLPIVIAYLEYSEATVVYEKLKLGNRVCEPYY